MFTEFAPSHELIRDLHAAIMARKGTQRGNRITFLCPAHDDRDPSCDYDAVKMVWTCRQCHAGGGLTDLAKLLDIDLADYQDEITIIHHNGNGHHKEPLPPVTFAAWCETRKLDAEFLRDFYGIEEVRHRRRPAIRYETKRGYRVRYLDGNKPKATWETTGSGQTLYNLGEALLLSDERVYLVNGEPSVWACQQRGVPAFCLCTGEMAPSEDACTPLRDAVGGRTVYVVYDRDEAGQNGARQAVAAMQAAGIKAVALTLPDTLPDNGDVDDLHRITGAGLGAALAGLTEMGAEPARIDLIAEERQAWQERLDANPVRIDELPFWLNRLCEMFKPQARMFDHVNRDDNDWIMFAALPFWSSLFPRIKLQNLNTAIWVIGLGLASSGKNAASDQLRKMIFRIHQNASADPVIGFTSGTPEGMLKSLAGENKKMIVYQREFAGWLKSLAREHMSSARENMCNLYDSGYANHMLSSGSAEAIDPHVSAFVTTTPESFAAHLSLEDMTSGYASRFMPCFPNQRRELPDFNAASWERDALVSELTMHVRRLQDITTAIYDDTGTNRDPKIIAVFERSLGLNTGEIVVPEDEMGKPQNYSGRHVARAKKLALGFALGEQEPQIEETAHGRALVISDRNLDLGIRFAQRGIAYYDRSVAIVNQSPDYENTKQIERQLKRYPAGLTQRELCMKTRRRASDIETGLRLLYRDGKVIAQKAGKTERWVYVGG